MMSGCHMRLCSCQVLKAIWLCIAMCTRVLVWPYKVDGSPWPPHLLAQTRERGGL